MRAFERVFFVSILLASWSGFALTETVDGITWTYTVANGEASVGGGSSSSTAVPVSTSGAIVIPSSLGGYTVTSIGFNAFFNCTNLTSVAIPNGVTSIGDYAFIGCRGLTNVVIPYSVTNMGIGVFMGCDSILDISMPARLLYSRNEGIALSKISISKVSNIPNSFTHDEVICDSDGSFVIEIELSGPQTISFDWKFATSRDDECISWTLDGLQQAQIKSNANSDYFWNSVYNTWFSKTAQIPNGNHKIRIVFSKKDIYETGSASARIKLKNIASLFPDSYGTVEQIRFTDDVTEIPYETFAGCVSLVAVQLPNTITNIADRAFRDCASISNIVIPDGVQSIGNIFEGCNDLEHVNLPAGLIHISDNAFKGCRRLVNISIPNYVTDIGVSAFSGCKRLTDVTIPNSITNIGGSAFYGCSGLTSMKIPDSVTQIGKGAFDGCSSLTNFIVGVGNSTYKAQDGLILSKDGKTLVCGVNGDVTIPNTVTDIGSYAFSGFSGLTNVTTPESVTTIDPFAFLGCSGLTSISIPNSVRSIGGYAFYNCKNLVGAMTIPDGVTRIEDFTFYNCSGLTSMTIPNTVTSIGASVFRGCKGFTGIMTIPPSVTSIGTAAFYGCSNLKGVNIEDVAAWCNITFGNAYANPLRYARNLYIDGSPMTDLTIPDSVTSISSNSFYNCTNLLSLAIPTGVTRIGAYSFYGCGGLTNVTVSESVAAIDTYAFYNCNRLARMTFSGNAPVIGSSVFVSGSPCTVYVRRASTGWGVTIPGRWNGIAIDYLHYAVTMDANGGTCEMATLDVRDGSSVGALPVPTWGNAVFLGWFTEAEGGARVDESLIVTESTTLYAHWLTEVARPVIVSTLGSVFRADSCEVSITSETEGATIYYTDDGTTPKRYDDYLYAGPMTITDTTTFKAVAVVGGLRSAYTTVTITKHNLTLDEALNVGEGVVLATNPDLPWQPVYDAHAKLGDATARSCAIGNRTNTWFTATVSGAGTMSFWCKVSCEHDDENLFTCDRLMAYTNGVEITDWRMDGETDWTQRTLTFAGGENTVKWVYYKDKSDADGEDCAWVDGIEWTPSAEAMLAVWLAERNLTADTMAANGRTAAECYALGLDPALATNDFRIVSIEMVDGKPKVEWEPMVNRWTGAEIQAVLKGAATLEGPWEDVPEGSGSPGTARPTMRFFKVEVEVQ